MKGTEDRDQDSDKRRMTAPGSAVIGRVRPPFPPIALWRHRGVFWWEADEEEGEGEESLLGAL